LNLPIRNAVNNIILSNADEVNLWLCLQCDIKKYFYSAVISIGNALFDIDNGFYSWAIAELYYSVFYMSRVLIGYEHVGVFYSNNKPYLLKAIQNESPKKLTGNTHNIIINQVEKWNLFPGIINQKINNEDPFAWLTERRTESNYSRPKFTEPDVPPCLKEVKIKGIRRSVMKYLNDTVAYFPFDAENAIVALPLFQLGYIKQKASVLGLDIIDEEDRVYLKTLIRDRDGPISVLNELVVS